MAEQLSKTYDPKMVEQQANGIWQAGDYFHADPAGKDSNGKTFTIMIPPPNVTAPLHLGHALNNTLQDILIRYRRMQNYNTLWMPGTDHAGIATQTVVEKRILAEENKRRTDFKRDEFVSRVQAWKDEYEAKIIEQLKAMGCSCDWKRTRFTMDEVCAKAVRATFFKLFKDGLIYRGKRLVNWDPATQTVLADDEVEHELVQGHFWYLKYPLVEPVEIAGQKIEHVTVATTRPETMLGDTAVAMNPNDKRAKYLVGKSVRLPIVGRIIPIVADEHVVLPDPNSEDEKAKFSTGFLKVTPAHDPDDWAIGQRHNLDIINVMAPDGSISDKYGWPDAKQTDAEFLLGMDRFEARHAIVEWFRTENLLAEVREYAHEIGHSYRSHVPIEPYLSDQWYIAVKQPIDNIKVKFRSGLIEGTDVPVNSLAGLAIKPLVDKKLRIIPNRYEKTYQGWLENLRDWPISRQLWWGHRIPVWRFDYRLDRLDGTNPEKNFIERFESVMHILGFSEKVAFTSFNGNLYIASADANVDKFLSDLENEIKASQGTGDSYSTIPPISGGWDYLGNYVNEAPELDIPIDPSDLNSTPLWKLFDCIEKAERDPDVLDTWFSSALWPFSTLGWPEKTVELKTYYPGSVLCTAREIITLWVSRMVMMGQYCAGDIPFKDVFIHAMIQDGQGRKMSKSLGNGIDPLVIIDSHGADAMRFTLASMTTETQDVRMPVETITLPDGRTANTSTKFDLGRNFCNKLWNASRFAMMNLEEVKPAGFDKAKMTLEDKWILSRLMTTIKIVTEQLDEFKYNEPLSAIYKFFWNDFCDWYLEWAKPRMQNPEQKAIACNVLAFVLDQTLRLLHPFVPFITEGMYQKLIEIVPVRKLEGLTEAPSAGAIVKAKWPVYVASLQDSKIEEQIETIQTAIRAIRDLRSRYDKKPGEKLTVSINSQAGLSEILNSNRNLICHAANLGAFTAGADIEKPQNAAAVIEGQMQIYLHDAVDKQAEANRLQKQKAMLENGIKGFQAKLANENYISKAKPEIVAETRAKLAEMVEQLNSVEKHLAELG